jgi:hypothetical protein
MLEDLKLSTKISALQVTRDQNDAARFQLKRTEVEHNALAKKIEDNEFLLEQAEEAFSQAVQRRDEFVQRQTHLPPLDSALEVIRKSIIVQERQMDQILARRQPLVLKSPIDGVVSQILRRPVRRTGEGVVRQMLRKSGEAIMAGEPILTVSAKEPSEIIAWVGREQYGRIKEGMNVQVVKEIEPPQIAVSKISYLGPIMEVIPQRMWMVPDIPEWGRPMLIDIPPGLRLIPGEVVAIKTL